MSLESLHREHDALARVMHELDAIRWRFRKEDRLEALGPGAAMATAASSEIPGPDWDCMLGAVSARLRGLASQATGNSAPVRSGVLECAEALDLLRASLAPALAGQGRLAQTLPLPDRQPPALALLYVDLDGLGAISILHGQEAGAELLRIAHARLRDALRPSDRVTHLGGDVFACLLPDDLDHDGLRQMAAKVFGAVSAPMSIVALQVSVHPSIGIAVCPGDGVNATTLLDNADAAMARAKRQRMDFAFYDGNADH